MINKSKNMAIKYNDKYKNILYLCVLSYWDEKNV